MGNPTCWSSDAEGLWYLPPHLKSRYFLRLSVLVRSVFRSCDLRLALMLSFSLHVFIVYRAFYPDCCCHGALGRMSEGHQPHLGMSLPHHPLSYSWVSLLVAKRSLCCLWSLLLLLLSPCLLFSYDILGPKSGPSDLAGDSRFLPRPKMSVS